MLNFSSKTEKILRYNMIFIKNFHKSIFKPIYFQSRCVYGKSFSCNTYL